MQYKVMVSAPYMQPVLDRFRPSFDAQGILLVVPVVRERLEEVDLLPLVGDLDGVICGDDRFTERVLSAAPKLRVISKWGTGIDSIDKEACHRLGIALRNTPGAFSEPVADTVLGHILSVARNLVRMDQDMKRGIWNKIQGTSLGERTLGIIGVGNVGKAVAKRAQAFGMRLLGNDPIEPSDEFVRETKIEMMSKAQVFAQADFLSLNCDLNPTSYHILSDSEFSLMKPSSFVINTARGPLIDESALIRALEARRIAGAALDVFEAEPLSPRSPLCRMDNVFLAPHNANSSPQAWERTHANTINNLLDGLKRPRGAK